MNSKLTKETKICSKCKQKKLFSEFEINRNKCKKCRNKEKYQPSPNAKEYNEKRLKLRSSITREFLINLYINEGKTQKEISKILGCHQYTIHSYLEEFGLLTKENKVKIKQKTRLRIDKGYRMVYRPNHPRARSGKREGCVFEYILIAEKKIGRSINRNEAVHHIDFDKENSSPNNLFVCSPSKHSKAHASIETACTKLIKLGIIKFNEEKGEYYV